MINCAIYPRKSKANDNSQSMQQQIADCTNYINSKYDDANIIVYGGDYALTGHSTKNRKDFLRMMDDVRAKKIQLVVIMRYDRIARNMRDFCNLYHDMEQAGCNLISVSQQIDTSTPYGKNFMYQMASMAELEWAITSERYKDTSRYKREHGYAYTGRFPRFGFKIEKIDSCKRVVHDREEETRDIFDHYLLTKSKQDVVRYVREKYDPAFTRRMFERMVASDLYIGRVKDNDHFCEPYFTEEYMDRVRSLNQIKATPSGYIYLFTGLIKCPICGRRLSCNANMKRSRKDKKLYIYYRCPLSIGNVHNHYAVNEEKAEQYILDNLKAHLDALNLEIANSSSDKEKSAERQIKSIESAMQRLDHMYELGRISIEEYDRKIEVYSNELSALSKQSKVKEPVANSILVDDWKNMYNNLSRENKRKFLQSIIAEIVVDEKCNITNIFFN